MTRKQALAVLATVVASGVACSSGTAGPAAVPPGAPTAVIATAAIRSASVTWSAPTSDGGSSIIGFQVIPSPAAPSAIVTLSGTAAAVSGLANGTTYRFSVIATNAAGTSAPSAPSAAVTTLDVPGAPVSVVATAGDRSAIVSWSAPSGTGGSPLTGYTLMFSPALATAVISVSGTSATVSGLTNGTGYSFRVLATNAVGDGPASAPSGTVTPSTLASIALTPSPLAVPRGAQRQLTAMGTYDAGSPRDVTADAQWASSNPTVASVVAGLVTAVTAGTATITASVGTVSRTVAVTVAPAVASVSIFPPSLSFPLDRSVQLAALATLEDGSRLTVTSEATWSSGGASVLVASGKLAAASGAGPGATAAISARYGGVIGTASATLLGAAAAIGPGIDDDPLLGEQWHLRNTGQSAFAQNTGIAGNDIGAGAAYRAGVGGRGVKIAVVDSGLEIAHEDLAGNLTPGSWNFLTSTTDPTSTATTGDHGTSVAGLIAAVRGNAKGGMGVAPMALLNGYNFVEKQSTATFVASLGAGTGVAGPKSFDAWVFNQSFGLSTTSPVTPSPTREAQYLDGVTNLRGGLGAVYVKSAGNGYLDYTASTDPDCTASNAAGVSCENASMDPYNTSPMNVVVGALDANGKRSSYSTAGAALWVSAPGGEFGLSGSLTCGGGACPSYYFDPAMITTDQSGCSSGYAQTGVFGSPFDAGGLGNTRCNYTNGFNGTSSAAPVVAGVVALLLEVNPSLTWRDVKNVLASTARQVDAAVAPVRRTLSDGLYVVEPGWVTNGAGYRFHDWYGFGAVDVDAAVAMASGYAPATLGAFKDGGWLGGTVRTSAIPDHGVAGAAGDVVVPASAALRVEAVQVRIQTDHTWLGDLGVELTSPAGTTSVLLNAVNGFGRNAGTVTIQLASNAFYGEASAGTWTLKVVDASAGYTGRLVSWQIRIYGH